MIPNPCKIEGFFGRWDPEVEYFACASDVDPLSLRDLLELADADTRALWNGLELGYTETTGHPLLREAIADQYPETAATEVTVCAGGAVEALFLLAHTLLGPGDHAVVVWPAFESLHRIAPSLGATITGVELDADNGWRLDIDAVRKALQPNTRALFVNFPHNPTGALPSHAEFAELLAMAGDAGVTVVSDEVYRHLEYDDADTLPAACDLDERAVSVGVMSKAYALAGLRIGWFATRNPAITATARTLKDYTTVCSSAPAEILSLIALRAHDHLIERSRTIIKANLAHAESFFGSHPDTFAWAAPAAGMLAFPRLLLPVPVEDFVTDLVRDQRVLLLPGTVFDTTDNRFRVGLGRSALPQAFERMEEFLTARGH
ncbi:MULTISPECIES: pyridoxal phosphate-dependent aminotransferase [Actinoalloteichus]|uniref:Aspartate/tyrosine/aromatic aminotransferase n=1 Tax=Actinoalloteichus fjordicus TaxID=1612552 RepID=A0AAC9PQH9_9PSEU|nr:MULTISPECIES: pyridoxal phosphate-dependent aminotransferase [Actinoalloteichus]APU13115.1 aspartate/tyrosine/aromatic aminotransferase [Actinoalloteichus fjordicus]APU19066.1 aspartate/tyrosine/aromatic aminotransferase [Actinoalloteichus sp. GBA129-24]